MKSLCHNILENIDREGKGGSSYQQFDTETKKKRRKRTNFSSPKSLLDEEKVISHFIIFYEKRHSLVDDSMGGTVQVRYSPPPEMNSF
mmetsp:Transcript_4118/g.4550  ORF Transcript_4118/g.4550 Transcript_4118/m.4550 type:complete len:88 (+) Transcript_4118:208-471(+)